MKKSTIFFDELIHGYLDENNNELPGVTTLLKKHGLGVDYSGIDETILARAAARGTAIHKAIEDYDNARLAGQACISEVWEKEVLAYKELCEKNNLDAVESEWLVNNDVCASSIDKVFSDFSLGDIKTSARIHADSYTWQLSIYKYLLESMNEGLVVPHLYIVHVRDGKAKLMEVEPIPMEKIENLMQCEREGTIYSEVYGIEEQSAEDTKELSGILSGDELSEYRRLLENKAQIDEAKEAVESRLKELNDKLVNFLVDRSNSGREGARIGNATLSWVSESKKISVDSKKLKEKYPDIYDECAKISTTKGYIKTTVK